MPSPLPFIVLSIPVRSPHLPRWRRQFAGFLALCTALLLAGCDRQKGAEPQPKEISSATKGDAASGNGAPGNAASAPAQRYSIDLSAAGTPMPSMQVTGPDGRPRNLTTLRGKPVLLNLWATWCAPCVEELPTINALAARAGDSAHVVALSQDIGGDATVPTAFLAERGWTRIQSWYDPDNAFGIAVGGALPTTILYNSDGLEVGRVIGPLDWTGPQAIDLLTKTGFNI